MNTIIPTEPGFPPPFPFYALLRVNVYKYGFQRLWNATPALATATEVIAWIAVLATTFAALDAFFYAIFTFRYRHLGWYGSFHERYFALCKKAARETVHLADLAVKVFTHCEALSRGWWW